MSEEARKKNTLWVWTSIVTAVLTRIVNGRSCLLVASGAGDVSDEGPQLSAVCPYPESPQIFSVSRLPLNVQHTPLDVAYHHGIAQVIWTEYDETSLASAIYRAPIEGGITDTVKRFPSGSKIEGVAVDEGEGWVYLADAGKLRIGRVNLDGDKTEYLVTTGLRKPRDIAVHPVKNFLFWTDWEYPQKIERADMLGGNRRVVANGNMICPNGLAIDLINSKLYWCDCALKTIEMSNLDGSNRRVIHTEKLDVHYYSIGLDPQNIYLTDWESKYIRRLDRATNETENFAFINDGVLYGMIVADIPDGPILSSPVSTTEKPADKGSVATSSIRGGVSESGESGFGGTGNGDSGIGSPYTHSTGTEEPGVTDGSEDTVITSGTGQTSLNGPILIIVITISILIVLTIMIIASVVIYRRCRRRPPSPSGYEVPISQVPNSQNEDPTSKSSPHIYESLEPTEENNHQYLELN